jgi:hypothetical protein
MNQRCTEASGQGAMRPLAGALVALLAAAGLSGACGVTPGPDYPTVHGRRAQITTLAADSPVPYRVGAYELVFAEQADVPQPRRAALLVSLVGGQGHVDGFAEWGPSGKAPKTYAVGGWARQRNVQGDLITVLELALERLDGPETVPASGDGKHLASLAVRVVVNETSGDATLTRRR